MTAKGMWAPSSPRRLAWRLVRDSGARGLRAQEVARLLPGTGSHTVAVTLTALVKGGFLQKVVGAHRYAVGGTPYFFDVLSCTVPMGELPEDEAAAANDEAGGTTAERLLERLRLATLDADPDSRDGLQQQAHGAGRAVARMAVRSVFEFSDPVALPPRRNVMGDVTGQVQGQSQEAAP